MQLSNTKKQAGNAWIQFYDIWEETKTHTGRYQICDYLGVRGRLSGRVPKELFEVVGCYQFNDHDSYPARHFPKRMEMYALEDESCLHTILYLQVISVINKR